MRRQDIQLLALARQGDIAACCEAGRRYLLGADGFAQHIATGIDYLSRPNVKGLAQAARIIAESLPLEDIVLLQQEGAVVRAAAAGSAAAQMKLGAWLCVRHDRIAEGARWLEAASAAGHEAATRALAPLRQPLTAEALPGLLRTLSSPGDLNAQVVAVIAIRRALTERDVERLASGLRIAFALTPGVTTELAALTAATVALAEETGQPLRGIDPKAIEACLEIRASRGDRGAAYSLGRALCGIACGSLSPSSLSSGLNMRKGAALLLRAADAGCDEAWLHLYRLHADHRLSIASPQMARFCLEKAALGGQPEAQRRLGALVLRTSDSLSESEEAIQWLHQAANAKDMHAKRLLKSLVLPMKGGDEEANSAIELVRRDDPLLAIRLELARHFGLTKPEALCVDPVEGMRPWGLVVGKNPFISQIRMSAARAIPALSEPAMDTLRRAASIFSQLSRDALAYEGDLRRRSSRQRRAFERHGLDEAVFFASATSMTLEALRVGPKWACKVREPLQLALAA